MKSHHACSYIAAAILAYVFMQLITQLRQNFGKMNLSNKALIDERFLA
jgi:hypothetical protein